MGTKGARTSGGTDKMAAANRRARFMVRSGEKVKVVVVGGYWGMYEFLRAFVPYCYVLTLTDDDDDERRP